MKSPELNVPPAGHVEREAAEPTSDIETLGAMLDDHQIMGKLLRQLPFERIHYRSNLRLILARATRMRDRCRRLLEEAEYQFTDRPADIPAGSRYVGKGVWLGPPDDPQPSNKIDSVTLHSAEADEITPGDRRLAERFPHVDDVVTEDLDRFVETLNPGDPALPHRRNGKGPTPIPPVPDPPQAPKPPPAERKARGRSTAVPVEGGITPAIRELLRQSGPLSTIEIMERIQASSGATGQAVKDALAKLRVLGEVKTTREGAGFVNSWYS